MNVLGRMRPVVMAALVLLNLLPWAVAQSTTSSATATATAAPTARATRAATRPAVDDVILLDELVDKYEAVPFSHKAHAAMAEMWNGCETCHHHTPAPGASSAATAPAVKLTKDNASLVPACKSCHPIGDTDISIHRPSLKGAYHRQCLNCHRDWMESNACLACHAVRGGGAGSATAPAHPPTPDDITGRMHKPIPAPATKEYNARFTPVAGPKVLFRHDEHVKSFGIKCASCHHQDSCASCHSKATPTTVPGPAGMNLAGTGSHPLKPGRTWQDTHGPCAACHVEDKCAKCHYQEGQAPPPLFAHKSTGQELDKDHAKLACATCHLQYKTREVTCGGSECHEKPVTFPAQRPGPYTPLPATLPAVPSTRPTTAATTQPGTKPLMIKIRRGGS